MKKHLDEKKAEDIVVIDLMGKSSISDYMIIASGSGRQIGSIADTLYKLLKDHGILASIEGVPQCDWVLIDARDVVVHLFKPEVREIYNLEKMWQMDVPEMHIA